MPKDEAETADTMKHDYTLLSNDDMKTILSGLQSLDSVSGTDRYRSQFGELLKRIAEKYQNRNLMV